MTATLWMLIAAVAVTLLVVDLGFTAWSWQRRRQRQAEREAVEAGQVDLTSRVLSQVSVTARPLVELLLTEKHWAVARDVSERLIASGDRSIVAPLVEVLLASRGVAARGGTPGHPTPLQTFVFRILTKLGDGNGVAPFRLAAGLRSVDPVTRQLAAELLARFGDDSVTGALIEAMFAPDSSPEVVRCCGLALGRIGGPRALEALLRYLSVGERPVSAFRGLQELATAHPLSPDRARALVDAVLAAVERHPGTRERQCAATVLGALGPGTIPSLRAAIERHAEPHDPLGEVAVLALGLVGGPEAVASLQELSRGEQQPLRLLAVQALAGMKTPEARQALEDVPHREHDTAVGLVVAEALRAAGQGPSMPS